MLIKLLKPIWVHHDEKPIFSVDVHQDCLKFATGGQGMDSGRVVIWNLLPVLSEEAELDPSVPKILCQMDTHLACVNVVRWSQNGQMLASGSDDKQVLIWRKSEGGSGVFGTGGIQKNPETWKCMATLRGHFGDVLDLAWSPQDRWLASCSVDNTVVVWDVQAFPLMVAMLKGHNGLVKGVTWDPVGKYLASQSDDRSIKIWKTGEWTCSSTITEPFEECGGTTHVLRLSWSPDGQYLVSAHAMNGGGPTAQIIEREGWRCDKDFVGHRKAVTCVRFHNAILKRQTPKTNKPQQYCCLAVGSRDRSLSVWMTALQRPLIVVHELFNDSILDMSWGPEKCILLACSGDGTVACLQFTEDDLGTPLSEEEKNLLYQRVYGKSLALENGSNGTQDMLIENADLLNMCQDKPKLPTLPLVEQTVTIPVESNATKTLINGLDAPSNTVTQIVSSPAITKQLETRTADGKRRITPVFIPPNQEIGDTTTVSNAVITPTNTTSIAVVDSSTSTFSSNPIISEAEQLRLNARLVKTTPNSHPNVGNQNIIDTFPSISLATKKTPSTSTSTMMPKQYQASTTGPKIVISQTTKCEFQKTALDHRIHVHNGLMKTSNGSPLAKVTAYNLAFIAGGHKLWEMLVGSPIVNLNFCLEYVMLCSLDGTLRLLHLSTGKLAVFPIIVLNTPAKHCAFCPRGKLVGVITECGIMRVWNTTESKIELATNCAEISGKFGAVMQFHITDRGVPLVLFSNGNSYTYSKQLQSWLVLSTQDPLLRHGLQATVPKQTQKDFYLYPLTSVQAAAHGFTSNASNSAIDLNARDWQNSAKIAFIENQINLCVNLSSADELEHWYTMLAYQLAAVGTEERLRLLLDELLGSPKDWYTPADQQPKEAAIDKRVLFKTVLEAIKPQVKWQRIYMEYHELYENIKLRKNEQVNIEK